MELFLSVTGMFFLLYIIIKLLLELGNFLSEKPSKSAQFFSNAFSFFAVILIYCGGVVPYGIVWLLEKRGIDRALKKQKLEDEKIFKPYVKDEYKFLFPDIPESE